MSLFSDSELSKFEEFLNSFIQLESFNEPTNLNTSLKGMQTNLLLKGKRKEKRKRKKNNKKSVIVSEGMCNVMG